METPKFLGKPLETSETTKNRRPPRYWWGSHWKPSETSGKPLGNLSETFSLVCNRILIGFRNLKHQSNTSNKPPTKIPGGVYFVSRQLDTHKILGGNRDTNAGNLQSGVYHIGNFIVVIS